MNKYIICNTYSKFDNEPNFQFKNFLMRITIRDDLKDSIPTLLTKVRRYPDPDKKDFNNSPTADYIETFEPGVLYNVEKVIAFNYWNKTYYSVSENTIKKMYSNVQDPNNIFILPESFLKSMSYFEAESDELSLINFKKICKIYEHSKNTDYAKIDNDYFVYGFFQRTRGFRDSDFIKSMKILECPNFKLTKRLSEVENKNIRRYTDTINGIVKEWNEKDKVLNSGNYLDMSALCSKFCTDWYIEGFALTDEVSKAIMWFYANMYKDDIYNAKKIMSIPQINREDGFFDDNAIWIDRTEKFPLPLVSFRQYFRTYTNFDVLQYFPTTDFNDFIFNKKYHIITSINSDVMESGISEFIDPDIIMYSLDGSAPIKLKSYLEQKEYKKQQNIMKGYKNK